MTSPRFTLAVGPASASDPTVEIIDWDYWEVEDNLDSGAGMSFSCRGNSTASQAIDELATDVWLYQDSTLIYRMRIVSVEQIWGSDGEDTITVTAIDYKRILKARVVQTGGIGFPNFTYATVILGLIEYTQLQTNGDLGITPGITPILPSLVSPFYNEGTNIYDAIQEFTQLVDGVNWYIDANRQANIHLLGGFRVQTTPIVLGVNARQMTRPSSSAHFSNVAVVTGNTLAVGAVTATSPTIAIDPRGRWERFQSYGSETSSSALQNLADGLIDVAISPQSTWNVAMEPSRYFYDSEFIVGDSAVLAQPRSTVYPIGTPAPSVEVEVLARNIRQQASGEIEITISAVELS